MKFSIRELLLVTVIVALAVTWWLDRRQLSQVIEKQNLELQSRREQEESDLAVAKVELARAKALKTQVEAAIAKARATIDDVRKPSAPAPNPSKE